MRGKIFGLVEILFAIIYMGLGLFFLLEPSSLARLNFNVPRAYSIGLGLILVGYAIFRFYRVSKKFRNNEKDTF